MPIISGFTVLLVYQMLGEVLAVALRWPVPGPVIGMGLLCVTLILHGEVPKSLDLAATGLLGMLELLFVPAGVGIMLFWPRLGATWFTLLTLIVLTTAVTLAATALLVERALPGHETKSSPSDGWR